MNFLQKGLGALESRLDKVLLDETDQQLLAAREKEKPKPKIDQTALPTTTTTTTATGGNARISMQDRLAAAMARSSSPANSVKGGGGRTGSPVPGRGSLESGRGSLEMGKRKGELRKVNGSSVDLNAEKEAMERKEEEKKEKKEEGGDDNGKEASVVDQKDGKDEKDTKDGMSPATTIDHSPPSPPKSDLELAPRASIDSSSSPRKSLDPPSPASTPNSPVIMVPLKDDTVSPSTEELQTTIVQLRKDLTLCETRRQEEAHASSERIDALEEKIRYLARESADASRRRATSTSVGSLEKMLAEREEKIALLLEEGENLSRNELKLQNMIKKLRAKNHEEEKAAAEARRKQERSEKDAADSKEKLKRAIESEKRTTERVKALGKIESEIEALKKEKESSQSTIADLRERLAGAARRAEDAESKVQTEALEKERKATMELKAQVERLQSEAALVEERLQSEVRDLKNKIERDSVRAKMIEAELKGEQSIMESKMEALRARAEEVSSGAAGDTHAKLLRQVEHLQAQHAIANENWRGIEGSLLARVASLEKERNDLAKKEGDVRRKARDINLKYKALEMDMENTGSKAKDLESELSTQQDLVENLRKRLSETETALLELRSSFSKEQEAWQKELQSKLEEERTKWEEESSRLPSRPESPSSHSVAATTSGGPPQAFRKISGPLSTSESYFLGYTRNKPIPRSTSVEPPTDHSSQSGSRRPRPSDTGFNTPPTRQDSALSLPQLTNTNISQEDFFENVTSFASPSSPHQRHPDIMSVSTIAAGPSVQLVERMSAAVRRLESEMAGSREEITRMATQRDEARREIVDLVREVEEKRAAEEKVRLLEIEAEEMRQKLETTLEMLGEKSECVEELKQDVEDLKGMYRDLVTRTIK